MTIFRPSAIMEGQNPSPTVSYAYAMRVFFYLGLALILIGAVIGFDLRWWLVLGGIILSVVIDAGIRIVPRNAARIRRHNALLIGEQFLKLSEENKALKPARDLAVVLRNEISELSDLVNSRWSENTEHLSDLGRIGSALQEYAWRGKKRRTEAQIIEVYDQVHAGTVLVIKSGLDTLGLRTDLLTVSCTQQPRTFETVKRILEALKALEISLSVLTEGQGQ